MYETNSLRFVVRNRKYFLQQLWKSAPDKIEWRDVPVEEENPLTEKEKVCDEILEKIGRDWYNQSEITQKIKEIRDRK